MSVVMLDNASLVNHIQCSCQPLGNGGSRWVDSDAYGENLDTEPVHWDLFEGTWHMSWGIHILLLALAEQSLWYDWYAKIWHWLIGLWNQLRIASPTPLGCLRYKHFIYQMLNNGSKTQLDLWPLDCTQIVNLIFLCTVCNTMAYSWMMLVNSKCIQPEHQNPITTTTFTTF